MKQSIYTWLALGVVLVVAGSCKKEYKDAPHPYNEITSFKIAYGVNDTLKAAITGDSVVVYWSGFIAVPDSIAPFITVSDKASVFPASGQKVALKTGVTFTVTAQDSSKATYQLIVKVYQDEPSMTPTKFSFNVNTAWTLFNFENLIPDTSLTHLYAIGKDGKEVNIPLASVSALNIVTKNVPAGLLDSGYYKLRVVNNMFTMHSVDSALRIFARPEITALSKVKGIPGDEVTITGTYFAALAADNTVKFGTATASILTASTTSLTVQVPEAASTGTISVTVGTYTGNSTDIFTVLSAAATTVTTFAGSGTNVIADGIGTAASFRTIAGITLDGSGNFYVVENNNSVVRKVSPVGAVEAFVGSGTKTFADGTGAAASFYTPYGIAKGVDGNLYLPDYLNSRIRKITTAGVVTTFAGSGTRGFADGSASTAMFSLPRDIAVDASGNIYISEVTNQRIRKITPAGDVSTFAGNGTVGFVNGPGASAQFSSPFGLAVDANGNVYVADQNNHCIRKITPAGVVSTLAGSGVAGFANGTGTAALFNSPNGIAIDANGFLYVADYNNHRIRQVSPDGKVITWAGSGENSFQDGSGSEAKFSYPRAIAIDASGNLFVTAGYRIRKITPP